MNETPTTDENGKPWAPDDFQPRANMKRLVSEGSLSCKEEVEQFSKKFAVEQDLVQAYIAHLQDLKIQSNIRARGCIEQKNKCAQKTVEEYAWLELVQSGNIKKLLVSELEKYLKHYKLSSSGTKADKIRKISLHVLGADEGGGKHTDDKSLNKATEMLEDVREGKNEESSSEDDIVLTELIEASDCDSEQGTAEGSTRQDYSLHASDKLWSVFQSDSEEEEFYGFSYM